MKYRVQVRRQVQDFIENLAPESRHRLKVAIHGLESQHGESLALRERLAGYHRLRVGGFRLIFRYLPGGVIECVFAEKRSLVYHLFEREMLERLRHENYSQPAASADPAIEEQSGKYRTMSAKRRRKRITKKPGPASG